MKKKKRKFELTERRLKANRENAKKSTGPKTEIGKYNSSMNALKDGKYLTKFHKIPPEYCGRLAKCALCGAEQRAECVELKECVQQEALTKAYIETHKTGNVKHIENYNILQLSMLDNIFTTRLRYAQIHVNETEMVKDKNGRLIEKQVIDSEYIYNLMNMLNTLSKRMTDMQLTKQTQENIDVAWAELAKADIDPAKAAETKQKIMYEMAKWREAQSSANEMEELDEAIRQHRKLEDAANDDSGNINLGNIGGNPFGRK